MSMLFAIVQRYTTFRRARAKGGLQHLMLRRWALLAILIDSCASLRDSDEASLTVSDTSSSSVYITVLERFFCQIASLPWFRVS